MQSFSKHANYDDNWQGGWEELFPNDAIEKFSLGTGFRPWRVVVIQLGHVDYDKERIHLKVSNLESSISLKKLLK